MGLTIAWAQFWIGKHLMRKRCTLLVILLYKWCKNGSSQLTIFVPVRFCFSLARLFSRPWNDKHRKSAFLMLYRIQSAPIQSYIMFLALTRIYIHGRQEWVLSWIKLLVDPHSVVKLSQYLFKCSDILSEVLFHTAGVFVRQAERRFDFKQNRCGGTEAGTFQNTLCCFRGHLINYQYYKT